LKSKTKTIEIEQGNSPFATKYLNDTENIEKLNSLLKEYFEKDIQVALNLPAEEPSAPAPSPVVKRQIYQNR
jgi:hypothetical protein